MAAEGPCLWKMRNDVRRKVVLKKGAGKKSLKKSTKNRFHQNNKYFMLIFPSIG